MVGWMVASSLAKLCNDWNSAWLSCVLLVVTMVFWLKLNKIKHFIYWAFHASAFFLSLTTVSVWPFDIQSVRHRSVYYTFFSIHVALHTFPTFPSMMPYVYLLLWSTFDCFLSHSNLLYCLIQPVFFEMASCLAWAYLAKKQSLVTVHKTSLFRALSYWSYWKRHRQKLVLQQKLKGFIFITNYQLVLWWCWLGNRKGIRPVKNWVVGCWRGYLSGTRCRFAYGQADATATHCLLLQ